MPRGSAARALLLCAWLCACAVNPVTGQREIVLMSPEREASTGAQGAEQVREAIGLVDGQLTAYVDAIGQRLARHSPRRDVSHRFQVVDMPEPNAFALPGGYIYVSRGLLVIANTESELAGVIGHEIGHVAARHSAQRETQQLGVGLLSMLGAIAAGAAGGAPAAQAVAQLGQVAGAGLIASYGRDQERQADEVGQKIAAEAGWDPAALARFLDTLGRHGRLTTGKERMPSFLDSHPTTAERVRSAAERARSLPVASLAPILPNRADFIGRMEGLLVGPDPAEGLFEEERFLHPGLDLAIDFPRGWDTVNQESAVVGAPSSRDAVVALELQGPAGNSEAAAAAFARENRIPLEGGRRIRIHGLEAYRAVGAVAANQETVALHLTFVEHPRGVLRLRGMTPASRYRAYAPDFDAFAGSLRTLSDAERRGIHELRLHVVSARGGETLAQLGERTENQWNVEETAIANALPVEAPLEGGYPVKIAIARPLPGTR